MGFSKVSWAKIENARFQLGSSMVLQASAIHHRISPLVIEHW